MRTRMAALAAALAVLAFACGGSDEPAAPTTTTPPATTAPPTTSAPATTTPPATTITTTPPTTTLPSPDAAELLETYNAAMAQSGSLLAGGPAVISESPDLSDPFFEALTAGGRSAAGDTWQITSGTFDTPSFSGTFTTESRTVGGVAYEQEAGTGIWELAEEGTIGPVQAALDGALVLDALTAEFAEDGYILRGTHHEGDTVSEVELMVDAADDRLISITVRSQEPREEFAELIGAEGGDVFATQTLEVTDYGLPMGTVLGPPVGTATVIRPEPFADLTLQVPRAWDQLDADEIEIAGVDDGYADANGSLALFILVEDVAGSAYEDLGAYVQLLVDEVLTELDVTSSEEVTTLQGGSGRLLSGIDPTTGTPFLRFVHVTQTGLAFNAIFIGDPAQWEQNRSLVTFLVNTFFSFETTATM